MKEATIAFEYYLTTFPTNNKIDTKWKDFDIHIWA